MIELLVLITIVFPGIASVLSFFLDGRRADALTLSTVKTCLALNVYALTTWILGGRRSIHAVLLKVEGHEVFGLIVDGVSMLVAFVVWTAGTMFLLYSVDYMTSANREHPVERGKGRFYGWMLLFIAATIGFVYSSTLLQLVVFFELMSLSCWGVVSYYLEPPCMRAALKALVVTHVGALAGLFTSIGIASAYGATSLFDLEKLPSSARLAIFFASMIAAITKSAQFPAYSWLPDAMVAPTPASAFLHGAAMVEMGVYLLARIVQFTAPLPPQAPRILTVVASCSLAIAALSYIPQKDSKRILAYSTIASSACMYLALVPACLGNTVGIYVSMAILAMHAYIKGLAFLTSGVFSYCLGTRLLDRIEGLIASPFIAFCWIYSLIGLCGVPPSPMFFAKVLLISVLASTAISEPYAWLGIAALILEMATLFVVALRWIHRNVLSGVGTELRPSNAMVISMASLVALSLLCPLIVWTTLRLDMVNIEVGAYG